MPPINAAISGGLACASAARRFCSNQGFTGGIPQEAIQTPPPTAEPLPVAIASVLLWHGVHHLNKWTWSAAYDRTSKTVGVRAPLFAPTNLEGTALLGRPGCALIFLPRSSGPRSCASFAKPYPRMLLTRDPRHPEIVRSSIFRSARQEAAQTGSAQDWQYPAKE